MPDSPWPVCIRKRACTNLKALVQYPAEGCACALPTVESQPELGGFEVQEDNLFHATIEVNYTNLASGGRAAALPIYLELGSRTAHAVLGFGSSYAAQPDSDVQRYFA